MENFENDEYILDFCDEDDNEDPKELDFETNNQIFDINFFYNEDE